MGREAEGERREERGGGEQLQGQGVQGRGVQPVCGGAAAAH